MTIKQEWTCVTADINDVGIMLGYDDDIISELMEENELFGMDGSGSISVSKTAKFDSPILAHIFKHIFETYGMTSLTIINDF